MKEKLIEFYLDWYNNFATLERMASHYGITTQEVFQLTNMGRKYHEERVGLVQNK